MKQLLVYHLSHPCSCTIDFPMYIPGEVVFYWCSDDALVAATILGPGAQSDTV